nr:MAG TPA: hypothetical protein [Caudoviricetes sp.]
MLFPRHLSKHLRQFFSHYVIVYPHSNRTRRMASVTNRNH